MKNAFIKRVVHVVPCTCVVLFFFCVGKVNPTGSMPGSTRIDQYHLYSDREPMSVGMAGPSWDGTEKEERMKGGIPATRHLRKRCDVLYLQSPVWDFDDFYIDRTPVMRRTIAANEYSQKSCARGSRIPLHQIEKFKFVMILPYMRFDTPQSKCT